MKFVSLLTLPLLFYAVPAIAQEELPGGAQAMIDAALENGDAATIAAVFATARRAFPDSAQDIAAIEAAWQAERQAASEAQALAAQEALRSAGLFDNWSGEGQLGGFLSTGNSEEFGATAALRLERKGIDWEHRLRFAADFRRAGGVTTREQYLALYEPRYQISDRLFGYGLAQFERDSRQGYSERYSASGGLGYRVIDNDSMELSVKAGPAYRVTRLTNGMTNSRLAGLFGLDFDWRITDSLTLTQDTNSTVETGGEALLIVDGSNTSLSAITGLEAGISDALTARVSLAVEYDSNPPAGAVGTDTLTRFTLVYGF